MSRRRLAAIVLALGSWFGFAFPGSAASRQVKWEELSIVIGRNVSIVMPGGAVISGRATKLEPEGIAVNISKTTDRAAYPKGLIRVPRGAFRVIELREKTARYRIVGTTVGALAGLAAGTAAALYMQGGIFGNNHQTAAPVVGLGIAGAGVAGGYAIGNAADRRTTILEIIP